MNSNLSHAVERGVFGSAEEAGSALRNLTEQITKAGTFPKGTLVDTARGGRFLVPVGDGGMAVYQLGFVVVSEHKSESLPASSGESAFGYGSEPSK